MMRAMLARCVPRSAHVGNLAAQIGNGFDALKQHGLQLLGGADRPS